MNTTLKFRCYIFEISNLFQPFSGRFAYDKFCQICSEVCLEELLNFPMSPWRPEILKNSFVCFVALRPKSTAMVIAGRSVHLTTLFPGQA